MQTVGRKKIWIDLDNSPHVPLFRPIIDGLESRGHTVLLTARDCFQVCGLCDLYHMNYRRIGRHYGKNKALKVLGLAARAIQMMKTICQEKPDLALSHGSRSQLIAANVLGIPSVAMDDYEHSKAFPLVHPTYVIVPEIIPADAVKSSKNGVLKYPGIKEDVYVPSFEPDPSLRTHLGISEDDLVIIFRPPATEAHYHRPESETLFFATVNYLSAQEDSRMKVVVLPRNAAQIDWMRETCPNVLDDKRFLIPDEVLNGLNLIWYSDLVISGGGTMNREAAALGVPVYSIFRGEIGAVDKYLAQENRLILIEDVSEISTKIVLSRRARPDACTAVNNAALSAIVDEIEEVMSLSNGG